MSPSVDDAHVYGGSSTIAFLLQVEHKENHGERSSVSETHGATDYSSSRDCSTSVLEPLQLSNGADLSILPIRYRCDHFLDCYWEFVHPLFPCLDKTRFCAKYEMLWLPRQNVPKASEETVFLCNLNLALGLGCQFCNDIGPNERLAMANQFYERSQHVLAYDILGSASVAVIQWLLLTAVYCQSTEHASRCWNSVGLAIRLAQSLGLHIEQPARAETSQIDLEMRRRVWHTCVVLDRFVHCL